MGIISFSSSPLLSILLAPVHALAAWFVPAHQASPQTGWAPQSAPAASPRRANSIAEVPCSSKPVPSGQGSTGRTCAGMARSPRQSRLKIVREFDSSVGVACAGRMVITGRMADVCAELDRMARLESAAR